MSLLLYLSNSKSALIERPVETFGTGNIRKIEFGNVGSYYVSALLQQTGSLKVWENVEKETFLAISGNHVFQHSFDPAYSLENIIAEVSGHYFIVQRDENGFMHVVTDTILSVPVYYYRDENRICFSNRLDWILLTICNKWRVSWQQIFSFVINTSCSGLRTFIENIRLANYGTIYTIKRDSMIEEQKYWAPPFQRRMKVDESRPDKIAEHLLDIVSCAMANAGKVAIPLTGGVDSRLILSAALKADKSKVVTYTHGYKGSLFPDVRIAEELAKEVGVPHKFIESERLIKQILKNTEDRADYHCKLGGQGRHNFLYDMMMYKIFKEDGCDLELKGLAGGLFKAKWHHTNSVSKLSERFLIPYMDIFSGKAASSLRGLGAHFLDSSYEDMPPEINKEKALDWFSYSVKFSNRTAPRTFFQGEEFVSINPFYDRRFLESYLSISTAKRENASVHLQIIKKLSPELLKVPYLLAGKYFRWYNDNYCRMLNSEILKRGYELVPDKLSLRHRAYMSIMRLMGVNRKRKSPPVPGDWESIKYEIEPYIENAFLEARSIFPEELEGLEAQMILDSPKFDSRIYRFYSVMRFIGSCSKRGVQFA